MQAFITGVMPVIQMIKIPGWCLPGCYCSFQIELKEVSQFLEPRLSPQFEHKNFTVYFLQFLEQTNTGLTPQLWRISA